MRRWQSRHWISSGTKEFRFEQSAIKRMPSRSRETFMSAPGKIEQPPYSWRRLGPAALLSGQLNSIQQSVWSIFNSYAAIRGGDIRIIPDAHHRQHSALAVHL